MAGSDGDFSAGIDAGLAAVAQDEIPGVEAAARVGVVGSWIQRGDKSLHQTLCRADVSVFEMFDLQLVAGDPRHVLAEPGSMVLTEAAAKRYFGAEDPVGAMVTIGAGVTGIDYLITGIVRNMPKHAHLRFDFMTASPLKAGAWEGWRDSWHPFEVYLLLREGVGAPDVESAMPAIIARFKGAQFTANSTYRLQQLNRIHLYSTVDFGMPTAGDIGQLRIVSLVGLFILLIACSNFTNLATARSAHRAREVGLRKVLGARRMQLAAQFTGEAILISFAALLLSILLAWQALPLFSHIGLGQISSEALLDPTLALVMVGLTLCVGALAGCYPASVLSALQPATVLKTSSYWGRGAVLRRTLVVFQFAVTIILIVSTTVVNAQTQFMREADLGLNKDDVVLIPIFFADPSLRDRYEAVKTQFSEHPNVLSVSAIWGAPGDWQEDFAVRPEGEDVDWRMQIQSIDNDFLATFNIELVQGRNINLPDDGKSAFLLNETAVRQLGWEDPIGRTFSWVKGSGPVVGVVADYHATSLHSAIEPTFFCDWLHLTLAVRMVPENREETMAFLRETWHHFVPDRQPAIQILSDEYDRMYGAEDRQSRTMTVLSVIGMFVACLGVLGLSAFTAEQRTREIGIRRILGSSVPRVLALLSAESVRALALAALIACPVAWYAMSEWLQDYPYAIELDPTVFAATCLGIGAVALATFCLVTAKAATANPVDSLRWE